MAATMTMTAERNWLLSWNGMAKMAMLSVAMRTKTLFWVEASSAAYTFGAFCPPTTPSSPTRSVAPSAIAFRVGGFRRRGCLAPGFDANAKYSRFVTSPPSSLASSAGVGPSDIFGEDDDDDGDGPSPQNQPSSQRGWQQSQQQRQQRGRPPPDLDSPFEEHVPKLNTVTLSGRVGATPEPRYFDDGKVVVNVGLAVKRKYHPLERKALDIQYGEEETDWFALEIWGRDAEYVARFVTKGARIGVIGSLTIDTWTDKATGEQRSKPKILVRELDILETKAEAELRERNRLQRDGMAGGGGTTSGGGGFYNEDQRGGAGGGYNPPSAGSGGFFD